RLLDLIRQIAHQRFGQDGAAERHACWARRLILFHDKRHPRDLRRFLLHVAQTKADARSRGRFGGLAGTNAAVAPSTGPEGVVRSVVRRGTLTSVGFMGRLHPGPPAGPPYFFGGRAASNPISAFASLSGTTHSGFVDFCH